MEIYKRHRPTKLSEVLGQSESVTTLETFFKTGKLPHALMLQGPSGIGKTSIARILRDKLQCSEMDYFEINCAAIDGAMETIRDIGKNMQARPWSGDARMWYLDEFQSLSRAGFAQQSMLKMLEDTPSHVYFILATTDPTKIIPAIRTRCTTLTLTSLDSKTLTSLLEKVAEAEELDLSGRILVQIAEAAGGSARQALVLLEQVSQLSEEEEQLKVIGAGEGSAQGIDLCRAIAKKASWVQVAKILKELDEEPEKVRQLMLGYARSSLLASEKNVWAYRMIDALRTPFYEGSKNANQAFLTAACFFMMHGT